MVLASRLDVAMSPAAVGVLWTVAVTIEFTCRGLARWQDLKLTATGQLNLRTLVVGADEEAIRLGLMLRARSDGVDPFGFVATPSQTGVTADLDPSMPVVGELDELDDLIDRYDVECLFVIPACLS